MNQVDKGRTGTALSPAVEHVRFELHEHGIVFSWPPGGVLECNEMTLPGGALIYGEIRGNIRCRTGSVLICKGAKVIGDIEADKIFIEGTVASVESRMSEVRGRYLLAVSSSGNVMANLWSRTYAIHGGAIFGTVSPWV